VIRGQLWKQILPENPQKLNRILWIPKMIAFMIAARDGDGSPAAYTEGVSHKQFDNRFHEQRFHEQKRSYTHETLHHYAGHDPGFGLHRPARTGQWFGSRRCLLGTSHGGLCPNGRDGQTRQSGTDTPSGLRNLARALYEAGVIADDSMATLGQFVASAMGLSIDACMD
jgi:hypothetical protein